MWETEKVQERINKLFTEQEKKNYNWFTDPKLSKSEKNFHGSVLVAGWIIFVLSVCLLATLTHSVVQGTAPGSATVALSIVSFLLILFSRFCISGRGVEALTDLMKFSNTANHLKTLGFEMRRSDEVVKKIIEQEEQERQSQS